MHPLSVTLLSLFDALATEYENGAMPAVKRLIDQLSMVPIAIINLKVVCALISRSQKHVLQETGIIRKLKALIQIDDVGLIRTVPILTFFVVLSLRSSSIAQVNGLYDQWRTLFKSEVALSRQTRR